MDGMFSPGGRRGRRYDDFARNVPENVRPLFDSARNLCMSLGSDVVEDVRMHRVVFGKTMTFRWFADVEPESDGLLIRVQRSRKEPAQTIRVKSSSDLAGSGGILKRAYKEIT